jgi:hypothetical protein
MMKEMRLKLSGIGLVIYSNPFIPKKIIPKTGNFSIFVFD